MSFIKKLFSWFKPKKECPEPEFPSTAPDLHVGRTKTGKNPDKVSRFSFFNLFKKDKSSKFKGKGRKISDAPAINYTLKTQKSKINTKSKSLSSKTLPVNDIAKSQQKNQQNLQSNYQKNKPPIVSKNYEEKNNPFISNDLSLKKDLTQCNEKTDTKSKFSYCNNSNPDKTSLFSGKGRKVSDTPIPNSPLNLGKKPSNLQQNRSEKRFQKMTKSYQQEIQQNKSTQNQSKISQKPIFVNKSIPQKIRDYLNLNQDNVLSILKEKRPPVPLNDLHDEDEAEYLPSEPIQVYDINKNLVDLTFESDSYCIRSKNGKMEDRCIYNEIADFIYIPIDGFNNNFVIFALDTLYGCNAFFFLPTKFVDVISNFIIEKSSLINMYHCRIVTDGVVDATPNYSMLLTKDNQKTQPENSTNTTLDE